MREECPPDKHEVCKECQNISEKIFIHDLNGFISC